ncbi:MAG: fibronectin type III domain-containing protein [bacterium]|nr:fibronectin type III domain-containing protein [bacterium]
MSNGTSKPRRALQLGSALVAIAALVAGLTAFASAQTTPSRFYSGIITGPDFCLNRSLGGPVTYPFDSDRDGVADVCSLPRSRRETAARQNAMERLGGELAFYFGQLFAQECTKVADTFGEPEAEATDECAAPKAAHAAGRALPPVPQASIPLESTSDRFFSGPVITSRIFCLDRSFGGPVTYPFDSDGDGVADICSLPRTRRAAVARQNAFERLASEQAPYFNLLVAEECLRVPGSFGEPTAEARDVCALGQPTETETGDPLPTPGPDGTTPGTTPGTGQTPIQPPKAPVATNPGTYNKRAAQEIVLAPGTGSIIVGWQSVPLENDGRDPVVDDDIYDSGDVFEYIVQYSTNRNMAGARQVVLILTNPPSNCATSSSLGSSDYQCTISGLTDRTTYYVRVLANRGPGFSNPNSPVLSGTPGLVGPVVWPVDNPDTEDVDEGPLVSSFYGEIDVRWGAPLGNGGSAISHYILQWGTTSNLPESCVGTSNCNQRTEASSAVTAKITGLTNNTTYYVRLQGINSSGPGTWSTTQMLRLTSNLRAPGVPTNLALTTAGTGNSLRATWAPPAASTNPTPTHYIAQWKNVTDRENYSGSTRQICARDSSVSASDVPTGCNVDANTGDTDLISVDIPNLLPNKQYEVQVQAVNSRVAGGWSRSAQIVLGQAAPPTITTVVPGNRQFTVTWTEPTSVPAPLSYNLQYNTSSGFPSNCQTSSSCVQLSRAAGTTSIPISNSQTTPVNDDRIYYVRMQTINANGPGAWSPVVSVEPGTPIAPTFDSLGEDSDNIRNLDLTWSYSDETTKPDLTGFRVQWRTVGSTSWSSRSLSLAQSGCPSTESDHPYCSGGYSYTLPSLTTGREYEVQVLAVNGYGNGQWSTSRTDTPGESFIPTGVNVAIESGDNSNIEAQWSHSTSLTFNHFTVQWRTCGTTGYTCGGWSSSRNTADENATTLAYPGSSLSDGLYYQARVRANGPSSSGGSSAYAVSQRYLVEINDNGTPNDRSDDFVDPLNTTLPAIP